jgi:putative transposase
MQPARVYDASMPSHLKRYQPEGHYHFLTFSCYRRFPYLGDDRSRTVFLDMLETLVSATASSFSAMCLCRSMCIFFCRSLIFSGLDNTLRVLKGQTSKLLKGSRPQFWQSRYYDFNVFTQAKFVEKLRYIHRNPVTRGLVGKPEDYPWSSFRHWATGETGRVEIESHWTWTKLEGCDTPLMRKMRA